MPWPPWSMPAEPTLRQDLTRTLRKELWLDRTPGQQLAIQMAAVGAASFVLKRLVFGRRIANSDSVTPRMLRNKKLLRGYVTRVEDGDDFRLYHTPGFGWKSEFRTIPSEPEDLKDKTIHIRIAGIDAPESLAGREPQPGAIESLAWLKKRVEGKFVECQLLQRDQYGRIVADVLLEPHRTSVGPMMLRAGRAVLYDQKDAVYGEDGVEQYKQAQEEAQRHKRGIWKNGTDIETPAQYKRRVRGAQAKEEE
ncbi:staphylococcal nuclease [Lentinus tigrinus ALCF2SS1-7]|uniref:Staphylococcal nuclease n=1 Tax=Lentinus tigrinus ALCF2SS1-6 TaxID=1328759 RepID=A0A5C2SVK3_9APHY|nr:staphylococcal nuclease [Lentinus tigrinus ALCF2SS1-6]RPD79315.1 staphylococcal nuclease [Lentinus tigrinus ALCF2SS1-7]